MLTRRADGNISAEATIRPSNIFPEAMRTINVFHRVLGFYRNDELRRFGQQYVTEQGERSGDLLGRKRNHPGTVAAESR